MHYSITVGTPKHYLTPPVDIYETDKDVVIVADMPGVSKDRTEISVVDDQLTILGHFQRNWEGTRVIRECTTNDYCRVFRLSDAIDKENIKAKVSDGILELTLPKKASPKRQKILIEME